MYTKILVETLLLSTLRNFKFFKIFQKKQLVLMLHLMAQSWKEKSIIFIIMQSLIALLRQIRDYILTRLEKLQQIIALSIIPLYKEVGWRFFEFDQIILGQPREFLPQVRIDFTRRLHYSRKGCQDLTSLFRLLQVYYSLNTLKWKE